MAKEVRILTEANFDDELPKVSVPVLVDFWSETCGPCRMMAPILDAIARERADRLVVAKVDTDANPSLVERFQVKGLPTLILFEAGQPRARLTGYKGKRQLLDEIDAQVDA